MRRKIIQITFILFASYFFLQNSGLAEVKKQTKPNAQKETLSGEWVFRGMQKNFVSIKGKLEIIESPNSLTGRSSNTILGMNKGKEDILKVGLPNSLEGHYIGDYKVRFQAKDKANNSTLLFEGFISKNKSRMDGHLTQTFETKGPIYQMSFQQGKTSPQKVGENKYSVKYDFVAIKVKNKFTKKII